MAVKKVSYVTKNYEKPEYRKRGFRDLRNPETKDLNFILFLLIVFLVSYVFFTWFYL